MKDPRNVLLGVLLALAAFLAGHAFRQDGGGVASAQGYPGGTADSNASMIAVTGTIGSGVSVLWLIDTDSRQLAIYQCKGGKSVELVAARKIEWDLKIEEFHDVSAHSPEQLKRLFFEGDEQGKPGIRKPEKASEGVGSRKTREGEQEGNGAEKR